MVKSQEEREWVVKLKHLSWPWEYGWEDDWEEGKKMPNSQKGKYWGDEYEIVSTKLQKVVVGVWK